MPVMGRVVLRLLALGGCLLACACPALAFENAYTWNKSWGATGVKSTVSVANRYADAEVYGDVMVNMTSSRSDGHLVGMAWELSEHTWAPDGNFFPVMDIYYADGDSPYEDDRYILWYPLSVPTGLRQIEIRQDVPGVSTAWDFYVDGAKRYDNVWWPYPASNTELTLLEYGGNLGSGSYAFFGRHDDVYLRTAAGTWSLQTNASWGNRISQYDSEQYFYIENTEPYFNWAWRR